MDDIFRWGFVVAKAGEKYHAGHIAVVAVGTAPLARFTILNARKGCILGKCL